MGGLFLEEWQLYADSCGFKIKSSHLINSFISLLKRKSTIANDLLNAFLSGALDYHYDPQIGTGFSVVFKEKVKIIRLNDTVELTKSEFLEILAVVDALYSKIYPLGTIVEIDKELLTRDAKEEFPDIDYYYMSIIGQRISIDNNTYIDYLASFYPNGVRGNGVEKPIPLNNHLVKRVIGEGPETPLTKNYANYLRKEIISNGLIPVSYELWIKGMNNAN